MAASAWSEATRRWCRLMTGRRSHAGSCSKAARAASASSSEMSGTVLRVSCSRAGRSASLAATSTLPSVPEWSPRSMYVVENDKLVKATRRSRGALG